MVVSFLLYIFDPNQLKHIPMEKFDYQIVTSDNKWEGGGVQETKEEIKQAVKEIGERLNYEGRFEEIIVFIAPKMEQFTDSTFD